MESPEVCFAIKNPSRASESQFKLSARLDQTLGDLQRLLAERYEGHPPPHTQTLIYAGKVLKDANMPLRAILTEPLDLTQPQTLHLVVRSSQPHQVAETSASTAAAAPAAPRPHQPAAPPSSQGGAAPSALPNASSSNSTASGISSSSRAYQAPASAQATGAPVPASAGPTTAPAAAARHPFHPSAPAMPLPGAAFAGLPAFSMPFPAAPTSMASGEGAAPPPPPPPALLPYLVVNPIMAAAYQAAYAAALAAAQQMQASAAALGGQQASSSGDASTGPASSAAGSAAGPAAAAAAADAPPALHALPAVPPFAPMPLAFYYPAYQGAAAPGQPLGIPLGAQLHPYGQFMPPAGAPFHYVREQQPQPPAQMQQPGPGGAGAGPPAGQLQEGLHRRLRIFRMADGEGAAGVMRVGQPGAPGVGVGVAHVRLGGQPPRNQGQQLRARMRTITLRISTRTLLQALIFALVMYQHFTWHRLAIVLAGAGLLFVTTRWPPMRQFILSLAMPPPPRNAVPAEAAAGAAAQQPQALQHAAPPARPAAPPPAFAAARAAQAPHGLMQGAAMGPGVRRSGLAWEIMALVVGFFTSLLPSWNANAEDAAMFAAAQDMMAREEAAERQRQQQRQAAEAAAGNAGHDHHD